MSDLAFPEVKDFHELFPVVAAHVHGKTRTVAEFEAPGDKIRISSFCSHAHTSALDVTPSQALLNYLKETLCVPGDVSFDIVIRSKTEALVTARYSQIIASRWIALVDPATIPSFEV